MGSISWNCFWLISTRRPAKIVQKQFKYAETWVCFLLVRLHKGSCYWKRSLSEGFLTLVEAESLFWPVTFCSPSLLGYISLCMLAAVVTNFAQSQRLPSYLPDLIVVFMPCHEHLTETMGSWKSGVFVWPGEDQLSSRSLAHSLANLGSIPSALSALRTHLKRWAEGRRTFSKALILWFHDSLWILSSKVKRLCGLSWPVWISLGFIFPYTIATYREWKGTSLSLTALIH